jgi:hypothetical protein
MLVEQQGREMERDSRCEENTTADRLTSDMLFCPIRYTLTGNRLLVMGNLPITSNMLSVTGIILLPVTSILIINDKHICVACQ